MNKIQVGCNYFTLTGHVVSIVRKRGKYFYSEEGVEYDEKGYAMFAGKHWDILLKDGK